MKQNEGIISTFVQPPYKPNPTFSPMITNFVVSYFPLCGKVVSFYMCSILPNVLPCSEEGESLVHFIMCMTLRVDTRYQVIVRGHAQKVGVYNKCTYTA